MGTFIKIISVLTFFGMLSSCKTSSMETSYKSDMAKNNEELQKREQAERQKIDITNPQNNYGKPASQ